MSNVSSLKVPSYRRHKASGQAVVRLAGRDIYLGKHGSAASHEAYRRFTAEYVAGQGQIADGATSVTVAEVMAAFISFARRYYQKRGQPTREYEIIREVCRFIKPRYARTPAAEFGPKALKAVRQCMIEAGHSRNYINKNVDRMKRMFKWAAAEEMIPGGVAQALWSVSGLKKGRTEARESEPVQPVNNAIVEATLPHLPDVVADMVCFQRLTGCRPGEVCALRPCDVDRSGEVWEYRPESHKTEHHGRSRVIFIGPQAQGVLLRYLARDPQAYCFRPIDSEAKRRAAQHAARKTPLSCGNRPGSNRRRRPKFVIGDCYKEETYRRAIHRACDAAFPPADHLVRHDCETFKAHRARLTDEQRAELAQWQSSRRWCPNQLRHSAATEIRRRYGLEGSQVVLGHATARVTEIYAERDFELAARIAKEVG
jgi:integrase